MKLTVPCPVCDAPIPCTTTTTDVTAHAITVSLGLVDLEAHVLTHDQEADR